VRPALIFDLDGVLADSRVPITRSVAHALRVRGHGERSEDELVAFIGPPTRVGFAALTGEDPDSAEVEACVAEYRRVYTEALWETPSYPGVPEAVRELQGDFTLAVATSKPRDFAEPVLEAIGLADAFDVVAGPGLHATDDKTETVAEALAGVGGSAVAMVGDRRYDMAAARVHGLLGLGVLWGFGSAEELTEAGAGELVETPDQLVRAATRARLSVIS
jgi:phosphoglycolate phosphatase